MDKIITGFKTIEDVEKTLQWIEENTEFRWNLNNEPTKLNWWKYCFKTYQDEWGFYIRYKKCLEYSNINWLQEQWTTYEEINFKTLITPMEKTLDNLEKGDIVYDGRKYHPFMKVLFVLEPWLYVMSDTWQTIASEDFKKTLGTYTGYELQECNYKPYNQPTKETKEYSMQEKLKQIIDWMGKLYTEEQMISLKWNLKPYPVNEELKDVIDNLGIDVKDLKIKKD